MPRQSLPAPKSTPRGVKVRMSASTKSKKRPRPSIDTASSPDPIALSPATRPRRSRKTAGAELDDALQPNGDAAGGAAGAAGGEPGEFTLEQKLDAWQDFALEHYEMVEQLPLELHRNFRLLRELDDGCQDYTRQLEAQIRVYLAARLKLISRVGDLEVALGGDSTAEGGTSGGDGPEAVTGQVNGLDQVDSVDANGVPVAADGQEPHGAADGVETTGGEANDSAVGGVDGGVAAQTADSKPPATSDDIDMIDMSLLPTTALAENLAPHSPLPHETDAIIGDSVPADTAGSPPRPSIPNEGEPLPQPVPDGEGGLLVPDRNEEEVHHPRAFPPSSRSANGHQPAPNGETALDAEQTSTSAVAANGDDLGSTTGGQAPQEAGSKAGGAAGDRAGGRNDAGKSAEAENDKPSRHLPEVSRLAREMVRTCEEKAALAVGAYNSIDRHIRALDSALSAQETSLILGLRTDTLPSSALDQSINLPGDNGVLPEQAAVKVNKKKGRKSVVTAAVPEATTAEGDGEIEDADPNEPRYCYCNRVSFGKMIGCDNDECPMEWFHLACVGLQVEPTGGWFCDNCKPKIGLGMGGAGTVQPAGMEKRPPKKRKR